MFVLRGVLMGAGRQSLGVTTTVICYWVGSVVCRRDPGNIT